MMELLITSLRKEVTKLKSQLRRSSASFTTAVVSRAGQIINISNRGTQTLEDVGNVEDEKTSDKTLSVLQQNGFESCHNAILRTSSSSSSSGLFTRLVRLHHSTVQREEVEKDEEGQRGWKREGKLSRRGDTVAGAIAGKRYPG